VKKRQSFALLVSAFSAMVGLGIISPLLPGFAEEFGASGLWIGLIFAGFAISRAVFMPIVGNISDRIGRKIFVVSGLLFLSVVSLLYLFAHNQYALTVVRFIHGLAAAMVIPIVMAYVGEFAEEGKEGASMGPITMMFYLGMAAGPLLAGILQHTLGFNAVFYGAAFLSAIAFLVALVLLPKEKKMKRSQRATTKKIETPQEVLGLRQLLKYSIVKTSLLTRFIVALRAAVIMSFLPLLASAIVKNPSQLGIVVSIGLFFAAFLEPNLGRLSDRLGVRKKLYQELTGLFVGTVALLLMPFCPNLVTLLLASSFVGIGAALSISVAMSDCVLIGKKVGMGHWMGIFNTTSSLGIIIAPLVSGIVLDHLGIDPVFYVAGVASFLGSLLCWYYVRGGRSATELDSGFAKSCPITRVDS
jgi:DHA1 family multidrug resistance protein-like MFS transporter